MRVYSDGLPGWIVLHGGGVFAFGFFVPSAGLDLPLKYLVSFKE